MLSDTLNETMAKAKKYENYTKAHRFSKIKSIRKTEKSPEIEFAKLKKISENSRREEFGISEEYSDENNLTRLPFFKSIQNKLLEVFAA